MHVLLIGLGNMGNKYFWKLEQMGEKLVLCDIDPSKEKKPYPFYCHFGDVEEEVRAVIVAIDPREHVKVAKEFLNKGIPVLLEKPPALNSVEFEQIKDSEYLYISEVESYSVCTEYLRKPKKSIEIERLGRGRGYISPLWDLAWHDLYLLQRISKDIRLINLKIEDSIWTLEGYIEEVPFRIRTAWEHPEPKRVWHIDDSLTLDFGEEKVYQNGRLVREEKRDKLSLMLRDFLRGNFDRNSVERAYRNLKLLESIS